MKNWSVWPAPNAHVVAIYLATHNIYFPLQNLNGKGVFESSDTFALGRNGEPDSWRR
jgi:hypothetical protein